MSNARYNVERALAALAEAVGESIPLDDSGQCGLSFDSEVEITIAYGDESSVLGLRAPLMDLAYRPSADTLHAALAQNHGQLPTGYCVALDADSGQPMLMLLMDAALVTYEEFLEAIADMVALVPEVRERLG
jgi:hypothetical protein